MYILSIMKAIDVSVGQKVVFACETLLCKGRERGFTRFVSGSREVFLPNDKEVYRYDSQLNLF